MEFAVWHEGMGEGAATWVLFVDAHGDRFLLSNAEHKFYWMPSSECKLARVLTPDNPRLVMPVQPQQGITVANGMPNGNGLRGLH